MTDRELLELAYKAAFFGAELSQDRDMMRRWNPLTDDGDALRLAHAVNAEIHHGMVIIDCDGCYFRRDYLDIQGLRRGIVEAAAAFGKTIA